MFSGCVCVCRGCGKFSLTEARMPGTIENLGNAGFSFIMTCVCNLCVCVCEKSVMRCKANGLEEFSRSPV